MGHLSSPADDAGGWLPLDMELCHSTHSCPTCSCTRHLRNMAPCVSEILQKSGKKVARETERRNGLSWCANRPLIWESFSFFFLFLFLSFIHKDPQCVICIYMCMEILDLDTKIRAAGACGQCSLFSCYKNENNCESREKSAAAPGYSYHKRSHQAFFIVAVLANYFLITHNLFTSVPG